MTDVDRVSAFYKGRHILITGGTGFMGKVFVEKLLRNVPDIGKIYLLIRIKKGKDPKDRLVEMFQNPVSNYFYAFIFACSIIYDYNNLNLHNFLFFYKSRILLSTVLFYSFLLIFLLF